MKRYIRSSYSYSPYHEPLDTDEKGQTMTIDEIVPEAVNVFMNTPDEDLSYSIVMDAVDAYLDEYKSLMKFDSSKYNYCLSNSPAFDSDKGRFYNKYCDFADRCKQVSQGMPATSGYGKYDVIDSKMIKALKQVPYSFPYGWESQGRYLKH